MILLPEVRDANALARMHEPLVRAALAVAPRLAVGFVLDSADPLARELMASYAPVCARFGAWEGDGIHVFALTVEQSIRLCRAPDHVGERGVLDAICRELLGGALPQTCIAIAAGGGVTLNVVGPGHERSN